MKLLNEDEIRKRKVANVIEPVRKMGAESIRIVGRLSRYVLHGLETLGKEGQKSGGRGLLNVTDDSSVKPKRRIRRSVRGGTLRQRIERAKRLRERGSRNRFG